MELHRIATLTLDEPAERIRGVEMTLGQVKVTATPATQDGETRPRGVLIATVPLPHGVTRDEENFLVVPEELRAAAEEAIERTADVLAVFHRVGRRIGSAEPYVALSGLTAEERSWLNTSRGFRGGRTTNAAVAMLDLGDAELVRGLADRLTGVALLAETLSTVHPVGRYKAFVRFFEHAFARSFRDLEKKFTQFLGPAELGYTRAEVQKWVALRHGAVHGDQQSATGLVMERHVRELLPRIEQAAYDLLFNKAEWHDPSRVRRDALRHHVATTSSDTRCMRITKGHGGAFQAQLVDPFGAYPLDLGGVVGKLPAGWWWEPEEDD